MDLRESYDEATIEALAGLLREYETDIGVSLDFQDFEAEVSGLPGEYVPPKGCLISAWEGAALAGCAAFRPRGAKICEMKRLYVKPRFRGSGLGAALVRQLVRRAREMNYESMRLDTLPDMARAQDLYRFMGFTRIEPYYPNPVSGSTFWELML